MLGVPEGEKKEKVAENILDDIIAENFLILGKETDIQLQEEFQTALTPIGPHRHIVIKILKIKEKEKILKSARENQQASEKGTPIMLSADFSVETLQTIREWHNIYNVMRGKNLQPRILYPARFKGQIKSFTDRQKLKEFSTTKPALQEMLKGSFYVKK